MKHMWDNVQGQFCFSYPLVEDMSNMNACTLPRVYESVPLNPYQLAYIAPVDNQGSPKTPNIWRPFSEDGAWLERRCQTCGASQIMGAISERKNEQRSQKFGASKDEGLMLLKKGKISLSNVVRHEGL